MQTRKIELLPLIIKTSIVHTVTYFIAGVSALILLDYGQTMGTENSIFRPVTDPIVMAGPLFQPIRGVIFGLAFYLISDSIFKSKLGWLKLWWILIALGVLSTFGPAPGSIEAMIYTYQDTSFSTYVEVVLQALAFAYILYFWVNNKHLKWINWILVIAFIIVMFLPALGLLMEQ